VTIAAELKRDDRAEGRREVAAHRALPRQDGPPLALPQEIDEAKANAKFADGVLELALPKESRPLPAARWWCSNRAGHSARGPVNPGPFCFVLPRAPLQ
jgi:hypothetical protein